MQQQQWTIDYFCIGTTIECNWLELSGKLLKLECKLHVEIRLKSPEPRANMKKSHYTFQQLYISVIKKIKYFLSEYDFRKVNANKWINGFTVGTWCVFSLKKNWPLLLLMHSHIVIVSKSLIKLQSTQVFKRCSTQMSL